MIHIFFKTSLSSIMKLLDHLGVLFLGFQGTSTLFSIMIALIYMSEQSPFFISSPAFVIFVFLCSDEIVHLIVVITDVYVESSLCIS